MIIYINMKIKTVTNASTKFLASTMGIAIVFMILSAVAATLKPRVEKFTDCGAVCTI